MSNADQKQRVASFRRLMRLIQHYDKAVGLLYWDMRTTMPHKGAEARAEILSTLTTEQFKLWVSPEMKEALAFFDSGIDKEALEPFDQALIRIARREHLKYAKLPLNRYEAFTKLVARSETAWEAAKQQSDFALFRPYLEEVVRFLQEFVAYWGYPDHPYDALIDSYEPGMTVAQLDEIFTPLREKLVSLLREMSGTNHAPRADFLHQYYDPGKQREVSEWVLRTIGFDFARGRLDVSVHPFTQGMNPCDVRVTTRFDPYDLQNNIFSTLHEGGHALYEQHLDPALSGTLLADGASMAVHESQSRFWENHIGRSRAFWEGHLGTLKQFFPVQLDGVEPERFYRAVNEVKPSLIRTEADELTYNLHVMLRYELEKGLLTGQLRVRDLPELWREKMQEYLGVVPEKDAEGVLQDTHWSDGSFGYFPSYTLGNLYAAQFYASMQRELSNFDELVRSGRFGLIHDWLKDKIHRHGRLLMPQEIIRQATGEALTSDYLVRYLEEKFRPLYDL